MPGNVSIGHVRYSTTGDTVLRNVQPLFAEFEVGGLAIAHNGNLTNYHAMRARLVKRGLFSNRHPTVKTSSPIATSLRNTVVDRFIDAVANRGPIPSL